MAAANAPPAVDLATVGLKADSAYQAKDWATASALYQELSSAQPDSFLNWLRLGASLHEIGRNDTALKALEKARKAGAPPSTVHYQLARIESSRGNRGAALDSLEQAVGQGRGRPDLILAEVDFQPLRSDPRFVKLVADAKKNDAPCQYRAENRQFDFWLGNWAVTTTQEHTPVGRSHIESTIGGCVIWENWTSLSESGYTGKSYNIYNIEQKRWEQFWVDNQGGMIHFLGSSNAGVMDFHTADIPQADGSVLQRHLRFYSLPTGQVRQLSEGSTDSGRTWSVEYDFTYSRSE
jgi:tetratricopeptide (TPR) repeat protein